MSVKQFAAQMKSSIEGIKSDGTSVVSCDRIIAYLNDVLNSPNTEPSPIDIERFKATLQNIADSGKYQHEMRLEVFKGTLTAGQSAIRSSFLLNGGGAIALLAFITHLAEFKPEKVPEFAACLLPFTLGVLAITMTAGLAYLSQWFTAHDTERTWKAGYRVNISCIVLGFTSYGLFLWGLFSAYATLNTFH